MKKYITLLFVVLIFAFSIALNAQEDSTSIDPKTVNDGPYVFYNENGEIEINYIVNGVVEKELVKSQSINLRGSTFGVASDITVDITKADKAVYKFDAVDKLFAVSDIHGELEYVTELFINNNIIDSNLAWTFGEGHLMIVGDLFDRGDKVTELVWFIYYLEQQAQKAGGRVHFLLGNHETMPLQGDLRYLNPIDAQVTCSLLNMTYNQMFGANTVLGDWVRSKPIVIKIGELLFVHGGLHTSMIEKEYSIDDINNIMSKGYDMVKDSVKADETLSHFYGSFGPVWYRGYHYDMKKYKQATESAVDSILTHFDAKHIIVGHTVKDSVSALYGGKVIGVNQDYTVREEYEGLLYENGLFKICDIKGNVRPLISK